GADERRRDAEGGQVVPGARRLLGREGRHRVSLAERATPRRTEVRRGVASGVRPGSGLDEGPEDVLQDAVVAVVLRLTGGVDAQNRVELDLLATVLGGGDLDRPGDPPLVELGDAGDGEGLGAVQAQAL